MKVYYGGRIFLQTKQLFNGNSAHFHLVVVLEFLWRESTDLTVALEVVPSKYCQYPPSCYVNDIFNIITMIIRITMVWSHFNLPLKERHSNFELLPPCFQKLPSVLCHIHRVNVANLTSPSPSSKS